MGEDHELPDGCLLLTETLLEQIERLARLARRFQFDVRVGGYGGAGGQRGDDDEHPGDGDGLPVAGAPHGDAGGEGVGFS